MTHRIAHTLACLIALCVAVAFLAACTTMGTPKVETVLVNVPVPIRCVPNLGPEPQYPDTNEALAAVSDIFTGTQLLLAGRLMRIARDEEKTAALKACEGPP